MDEKGRAPGWDETRAEMVNLAGEANCREGVGEARIHGFGFCGSRKSL